MVVKRHDMALGLGYPGISFAGFHPLTYPCLYLIPGTGLSWRVVLNPYLSENRHIKVG
jgi:hypothetical protein